MSVDLPVAVLGPCCHSNHHHVSLSFLTVTSPLPLPLPAPAPAVGAAVPLPDPDEAAAPGPVLAPDVGADAGAEADPAPLDPEPAAPFPRMVVISPCMKAHGGLLGEVSNGQRSPLGQYTSPSPCLLWIYPLVHGKQNLYLAEEEYYSGHNYCIRDTNNCRIYIYNQFNK